MGLACEDLRDFLADGEEGLLELGAVRGFARERSENAVERGLGREVAKSSVWMEAWKVWMERVLLKERNKRSLKR